MGKDFRDFASLKIRYHHELAFFEALFLYLEYIRGYKSWLLVHRFPLLLHLLQLALELCTFNRATKAFSACRPFLGFSRQNISKQQRLFQLVGSYSGATALLPIHITLQLIHLSLDTGTIGPATTMPQFTTTFGPLSSTLHGLVVSTILIPAAISSFFGGHLANSVGRLKGVAIGAAVFGLGAGIEGGSVALGMLIVGRAVKGIGEGLFMSTSVV